MIISISPGNNAHESINYTHTPYIQTLDIR